MQISDLDKKAAKTASRQARLSIWIAGAGVLFSGLSVLLGLHSYQIASQALSTSQQFGSINAEVQWASLRSAFLNLNEKIREWEKSQPFSKDVINIESFEQLKKHLEVLKAPSDLVQLYAERHEKYESLKRVADLYAPVRDSLKRIDFSIPEAPKIPTRRIAGGGTIAGSIR